MLEGIICPVCETTLEELDLRASLSCISCKTDLRDRKFLDFLENHFFKILALESCSF